MTMGLPVDRDGYDLRLPPCPTCWSRGCQDWKGCADRSEVRRRAVACMPVIVPNNLLGAYINEDGDAV